MDKVRQNRADFNQACAQNLYPIQLAFSCPNRSIIPHLLGAGARAFPKSYSYVIADATNGQWSAVQDFLNWTIEAEQDLPRNLLGELLHLAICQNKPEQVRYLLSKGASQTYIQNGFTPWQKVSQLGFFELINVFLEFEFNSGMDAAADVLLRLCRVGRFDLAERLLRRDVSPNKVLERSYREAVIDARGENHIQPVPEDIIGFSPLFFAIALNAPQEFVRLLLEKGSNLDHLSATNLTPFRLAITNSKPETTRVLLEGDRLPDLKDSDFQLLCKIAKANTQLGWECIFILLHFEQQGKINHATRHTYYATMLKHAVNQDNVPAINVLLPICLDQNRHMEDSLSIVYAAKNGHWRALTAILLHAEHHHQPRDFLLALFYCVQQCVLNHISQELMRVIQDKIDDKVLSQDDIELSKLPQAFLGYDLLAVAIHFNNHKIMMQYILLHDANLTTHIEIAFRQNNAEAVKELARLGSQPKLQTLMSACSLAASWGLVKTFLDYSVLDEQQLLSYVSELRKETFHNQNVDLNYLETFAFRRELQQRQERHAQELQSQAFQFAQVSANGHCILKILLLSFIFNPSIECLFLIALLIHALYAERTFATTARDCFSAIQDASGTFIHTNIMFFRGAKNDDTTMPVYERQDQLEAQSDEEEIDIIDQGDRPWLRS